MKQKLLTIKELPESERPYEKCIRYGVGSLSNAELLAVIIRSGTREERSVDLACRVLNECGKDGNLAELSKCDVKSLTSIHGIGVVKAVQIQCAAELGRRMAVAGSRERMSLTKPASIADYYRPRLRHLEKETVYLLHADAKCRILAEEQLSIGTVNASMVSPREVFISALQKSSVYLILIHNHPSGDPSPSKEDIMVTMRIRDCGKLMGIELMDHIIIGENSYISLKENAYM